MTDKKIDDGQQGDTAILNRNNTSTILLKKALDRAGNPYYMRDGDASFFSLWFVEDVLYFMRLTFNDRRTDIFQRIHL